jgi:hypothetical protein
MESLKEQKEQCIVFFAIYSKNISIPPKLHITMFGNKKKETLKHFIPKEYSCTFQKN